MTYLVTIQQRGEAAAHVSAVFETEREAKAHHRQLTALDTRRQQVIRIEEV